MNKQFTICIMKINRLLALAVLCVLLLTAYSLAGITEITFEAVGTSIDEMNLYLVPADGYDTDQTIVTGVITYDTSLPHDQPLAVQITLASPALDGVSPPYVWDNYNEDRLISEDVYNMIHCNSNIYDDQWYGKINITEIVTLNNSYHSDYNQLVINTDTLFSSLITAGWASELPFEFSALEYDPEADGRIEFYRYDPLSPLLYKWTILYFNIINIQAQAITIDPIANAGSDQIVFDSVILDGSLSNDLDGTVVSYLWNLQHRVNPIYDQLVDGVNPIASNLEKGFYDVTLTITDDDGLTGKDTVIIVAAGECVADNDNDGYSVEMGDCNDNDAAIYPGAIEMCDGFDNNCDDQIDEGFDEDGDNYTTCGGDCNDNNPLINPAVEELPGNAVDENCDGSLGHCDPNASWKNHGMYVRCVAEEVQSLVSEGVISQEQGDILINAAATSDVGK